MQDVTLYVVRHGENPANVRREFSYRLVDYSLTPKGVQQAAETANYLAEHEITAIYSSPLKRALETAQLIAEPLGLPITTIEEFREVNVGDLEGQPPSVENWALHDEVIADWFAGRYERAFPGGEDFHEMMRRISVGLTAVLTGVQDAATTQRIVIVAHGGILNAMARGLAQPPATPDQVARPCRNCSISEFTAALTPAGVALQLQEWSACDHLTVD